MAKICTWNVNGIRATKNLPEAFKEISADVFCIQETKIQKDQIDEKIAFVNNDYTACFAIPKQTGFKGRSGCATYYLDSARPNHAELGILDDQHASDDWKAYFKTIDDIDNDIKALDSEGRIVITCHDIKMTDGEPSDNEVSETRKLFILNVYFPRADKDNDDRRKFKAEFNKLIEHKTKYCLQDPKSHIVIACDLNIQHKQIDSFEFEKDFDNCPDRKWLTEFLKSNEVEGSERHMIDSYRMLYSDRKNSYTCWPTIINGSRENNLGFRIDLMIIDSGLAKYIKDVVHLTRIKGSDHCPVLLKLKNVEFIANRDHPKGSCRIWPEFRKRQTTLTSFFTASQRPKSEKTNNVSYNEAKTSEEYKKLKLSPSITSQSSIGQGTCGSTQLSPNSLGTREDELDGPPPTAYQKIMQKKAPDQPVLQYCEQCGIVCKSKKNTNKNSKNVGKTYISCPNSGCKYFRWISGSNKKNKAK